MTAGCPLGVDTSSLQKHHCMSFTARALPQELYRKSFTATSSVAG
jgi:hypothetical protein